MGMVLAPPERHSSRTKGTVLVSTERRFRDAASEWFVAAVCIALAILPRVSWSQGVEAALRGRAAPNAQITVRNTATGLTRRTQAAADGSYSIVGLPPGPYHVAAGAGTETNVTLPVASTITLDLQPQ